MLPSRISTGVTKRNRGRPKTVLPVPNVFCLAFSFDYAKKLSVIIAHKMGLPTSVLTDRLAHISLAYGPMRDLQRRGRMKTGSTRRPRIHLAVLLCDISKMYAELIDSDAQTELRKINGFREERRKDAITQKEDVRPAVEVLARVVMAMWGDEVDESLQRPAREALKLI